MRRMPSQHERDPFPFAYLEFCYDRAVDNLVFALPMQKQVIRSSYHPDSSGYDSDKRQRGPVVETWKKLRSHSDSTSNSLDDPDDVGGIFAFGHEIDHTNGAAVRLNIVLDDRRSVAVSPGMPACLLPGREQPVAILGTSEQRREAGAGVEARETEPVDRSVPAHQRRGVEIAQECVVFDSHSSTSFACCASGAYRGHRLNVPPAASQLSANAAKRQSYTRP
jgi:hypothetical protein